MATTHRHRRIQGYRGGRALIARAHKDPASAISCASEARQEAENQALSSFRLYATSIEALSRVEAGQLSAGARLASEALEIIDRIPSEYGVEIRALACEALSRAGAPEAREARARAAHHARATAGRIRDDRLRALFLQRPLVRPLLTPSA